MYAVIWRVYGISIDDQDSRYPEWQMRLLLDQFNKEVEHHNRQAKG